MLAQIRKIFGGAKAGAGQFKTSPDGRYLSVNAELARIYRYESVEQMMIRVRDIQKQLYVDPVRRLQFVYSMERDGKVENFESEIYCADGSRIWITENARSVKDKSGALQHFEGTVRQLQRNS